MPGEKKIRYNKKRIAFLFSLLLLFILVFSAFRTITMLNSLRYKEAWVKDLIPARDDINTNILIVGVSYLEDGSSYGEQCLLVSFNPQGGDTAVIHIPGETYVRIRNLGWGRIGSIYSLVEEGQGLPLFINQVSSLLGIPVHYFIELDYRGIPEAVGSVKGVEVQLKKPLLQDHRVVFPEGDYTVREEEAYQYFTFQDEGEEFLDRLERQRQFMLVLLEEIGSKSTLGSLPRAVKKVSPYVKTNLTWRETVSYYQAAQGIDYQEEVTLRTIPGSFRSREGRVFWVTEESRVREMVDRMVRGLGENREEDTPPGDDRTKIEVLNGRGDEVRVNMAADMLRSQGYEVVKVGNADHFDYQFSQVISRTEDVEEAKEVAIMIPGAQLLKEVKEGYPVQVTVIIGHNYN